MTFHKRTFGEAFKEIVSPDEHSFQNATHVSKTTKLQKKLRRSERVRNHINNDTGYGSDSSQGGNDVDEHGNIAGLIDYSLGDDDNESVDIDEDYDQSNPRSEEDEQVQRYLDSIDPELRAQLVLKEAELRAYCQTDIPDKIKILQLDTSLEMKAKIYSRYNLMKVSGSDNADSSKIKKWLDYMLSIPWNNYVDIPIHIGDGYSKINQYLKGIKDHLDRTVYGQDGAKSAVMELVAQWIINPTSRGLVLGFEGPPGTGKTSLMRHGVAHSLNRPIVSIPLGGATGGSVLDGSNMVYEGASAGKIVNSLINTKCMNPVFYFDELDKISCSSHGAEISNVLLHLTDPSQNNDFNDKYLEIGLDLSKAVYIFSYNDPKMIDPILLDRIKRIKFEPFHNRDKVNIALNHALPKIYAEWGFKPDEIVFTPKVLEYIINKYTSREPGVRQLIHCMEMIVSKLNLCRISDPAYYKEDITCEEDISGENRFNPQIGVLIQFPIILSEKMIDILS